MSTPTTHPDERGSAEVTPTEAYEPGDRVWVYRDGRWRAGVIYDVSSFAATIICRSPTARGTEVEFRTARYVVARDEVDPVIDRLSYV